jgi:hypothetical protein
VCCVFFRLRFACYIAFAAKVGRSVVPPSPSSSSSSLVLFWCCCVATQQQQQQQQQQLSFLWDATTTAGWRQAVAAGLVRVVLLLVLGRKENIMRRVVTPPPVKRIGIIQYDRETGAVEIVNVGRARYTTDHVTAIVTHPPFATWVGGGCGKATSS